MSSITLRRCTVDRKTGKTMYDVLAEEAQALGDSNLGAHEIDSTFFRASPDPKGNIFYQKSDGTPFVASFIAEIGSEGRGTWMAAYYKKSPPAHKLAMTDASSKSHRMVLALRCPTGAPPEICSMFRNGLAACDTIRGGDEIHEADNNERFDVTEWINGEEDARAEDMVLLVRLHPTYEVPYSSAKQESSPSSRTPRKRISKVGPAANPDDLPHSMDEVDMAHSEPTERKIGDKYPPSKLSDHWGPYFAHEKAELVQRDYTDKEGKLIAPEELYATLTEGTLVLVMVSLATYVIRDQKTEKGVPLPDKKIYHVLVDRLKVLDRGDVQPWNPPVPEMPEARVYSPMTPQRKARDDATDTAFNAFGLKSSPSPPKRARRAGTGSL
ncbi:hypothetical protein B0H10DRAFT_2192374 [Mycena sp. CBHHK59/15]|nr:hypothetical protein B0H10DRAFT_2192374 [Mycena sp. CBHHK59/15]